MRIARLEEFKRLSKITIGFGAYIVVSAAFMLQVRDWLFKVFGDFAVVTCFKSLFILLAILTIVYAFKIRLSIFRLCATASIFVMGYLFSMWQPYFSEKTHVLTYGLLGYLAANDLIDTKRNLQFKYIAGAIIFVSFISASDEIFQGFLPYRVCEMRDFITNIISGVMGITLLFALRNKRRFPE